MIGKDLNGGGRDLFDLVHRIFIAGNEESSQTFGLEVNTEKTNYMSLSRHQNTGQNHDIKVGSRWFENVAQFRYLGTTITNEKLIQEEIKR
jgi:hypothetical protein